MAKKTKNNGRTFTAVVERCPTTHLFVGYVPGMPGAHSQGESLDELNGNLEEVVALLLRNGNQRINIAVIGSARTIK